MVETFKRWWRRLASLPFGKWLFSKGLSFLIPYTGTINPYVEDVGPGYAKVSMRDCRRIKNHLGSYHALAMANIGELTTGLALHFGLKDENRAILTNLSAEYLKKGRGKITAIAKIEPFDHKEGPTKVTAQLFDEKQDLIARIEAVWLVGLAKSSKSLITNGEPDKLNSHKNTGILKES